MLLANVNKHLDIVIVYGNAVIILNHVGLPWPVLPAVYVYALVTRHVYLQLSKSAFFGCNSKQNVQSPKPVANVIKGFKTGQYKNSNSIRASRILATFLAQVKKSRKKCDLNMICLTL